MSVPTSKEELEEKPLSACLDYKGSFEETKCILESFDDQTKVMKSKFMKRIMHLESENSSLMKELKHLKLENELLKSKNKEVEDLKVQNSKLKMKFTSVITLLKDDLLSNSTDEIAENDVVTSNDGGEGLNDEENLNKGPVTNNLGNSDTGTNDETQS